MVQSSDFPESEKKHFAEILTQRITELKKNCLDASIDAVAFGGRFPPIPTDKNLPKKLRKQLEVSRAAYIDTAKFIHKVVWDVLGLDVLFVVGPKEDQEDADDIFYENSKRKLFIIRSKVGTVNTGSYTVGDIDTLKSRWSSTADND